MIYVSTPLAGEEYGVGIKTAISSATEGRRSKSNVTRVLTFIFIAIASVADRQSNTSQPLVLSRGMGVGWGNDTAPPLLPIARPQRSVG